MMKILSLDLSLSNTGYAIFNSNINIEYGSINTKIKSTKCKVCLYERLFFLKEQIEDLIRKYDGFEYAIIEGYSYTKNSQSISGLYELSGIIINMLYNNNIKVIIIPPMTAKKYLNNNQAYRDGKISGMTNKEITYKLICNLVQIWNFDSDDSADAYLFGYILMKYFKWVKNKIDKSNNIEKEVYFYISSYIQNIYDCKMKHYQKLNLEK